MFVLQSYPWAVVFCVITMFCWGSWANTQKLAKKGWRFELFYWDYTVGVLLLTVILGLTLGSNGTVGRPFLADLAQASHASVYSALLGGAIFNLANILLVAAIDIAGMSVAFPVGIGLALVLGVVVNYREHPGGNAALLFGGVLLVVLAIVLDAVAYRKIPGTAASLSTKGLVLSVACGITMGFFYRFVAAAMYPDFTQPEAGKLGPYAAVFVFAVGIFLSNFILNTFIMKKPFVGDSGYLCGLFQRQFEHASHGNFGRNHLGRGHVVQHHCRGQGDICYLLWPWTGRDHGGGVVGRVHLEGISHRAHRHFAIDRGDVWLFRCGAGADHSGENVLTI